MTTPGWPRRHKGWSRRGSFVLLLGPILLSSCAAAPFLIPVAFEFAKNLFQTGLQNYGSKHRDNLSNLVNRLSSPYMQGLPGQSGFPGQPGMPPPGPGQQAFAGQPGSFDPSLSGFPAQSGVPPQSYPGQQAYPGQPYPGATTYPGATVNPYGTVQGYPPQPGLNPYDPNNPYGGAAAGPYGQPANAPVYGTPSPYGQQANPYGASGTNPYGTQQANPGQHAYGSNAAPYGSQNQMAPQPYGTPDPYGTQQANPGQHAYGSNASPYGAQNQMAPQPYGTPDPYGTQQANPGQHAYGSNAAPYGAQNQMAPQPYGTSDPYGTQQANPGQHAYGSNAAPYGSQNQMAPQPYGTPDPYGTQQANQGQHAYGAPSTQYGTADPYAATQPSGGGTGVPPQQGYNGTSPYGTPPATYGGSGASAQAPYGGQPYGGAGIYPRSVGPEPVMVDVAMIRQKGSVKGREVMLMNDGEVLKDGGADTEAGDRFKIVVRANCECYLYIMTVDGSGWAEPIYPQTVPAAPVTKDQEYAFPESGHWFTLDQVKGVETFFVVASAKRRSDLEDSMAQMAAAKRPETAIVAKVEEPPIIPRGVGAIYSRGILRVQDDTGPALTVTPLSYAASQPGQDVTVTRWFKHE